MKTPVAAVTSACSVIVLAVGVALAMHYLGAATWAEAIGVGASVMVAGFTFCAAVAAYISAASADQVARRATEALARTLLPLPDAGWEWDRDRRDVLWGQLRPSSTPAAMVQVRAEWHLTDGRVVVQEVDRVESSKSMHPSPAVDRSHYIELARPVPSREHPEEIVRSMNVSYWDEQRVGRWMLSFRPVRDAEWGYPMLLRGEPQYLR